MNSHVNQLFEVRTILQGTGTALARNYAAIWSSLLVVVVPFIPLERSG